MTDAEKLVNLDEHLHSEMFKQASIGTTVAIAGVGGLATLLASAILSSIAKKGYSKNLSKHRETSWKQLVKSYPEFKENAPVNRSNFDALFSVSPRIGSSPQFIAPILRQANDYATSGIPIETASMLANIESAVTKADIDRMNVGAAGVMTTGIPSTALRTTGTIAANAARRD